MSTAPMNKRHFLGLMAAVPLGSLVGCGGSSSGSSVRLVNASAGYASLDLYADDDKLISAVAFGTASSYTDASDGTVTTALTSAGSSTYLLTQSRTITAGTDYTIVAYGWEGGLKSLISSDNTDAADSGKTKVTVLNTASDAGSLDVYLTAESDSLDASTPVASAVAGGAQSSITSVSAGTYRLRVTAAEDTSDLRLDVSGVVLSSTGVVDFVLTPGSGGVLVHALQIVQGGAVTQWLNTQARVRVVAGVSDSARVSVSANGSALLSNAPSPTIGAYTLVDAGSLALSGTVNGTALAGVDTTLAAGADVTLLVHGTPGSAALAVINDDNRLPSNTAKLKLRLLNAMSGMADYPLTLTVDYAAIATDVAEGAASDAKLVAASSAATVEVSSALSSTALLSLTDTTLSALGVYTVFMFGTSDAASGALRKER